VLAIAPLSGGPASADSDTGAAAFDLHCISCHGPDARGIENVGVDLVASALVSGSSQRELVGFLAAGRTADDPASLTGRPMPGFAWLSESELAAIAAFLKARSGDP
jgi:mono/diheme cytochrome c family protein